MKPNEKKNILKQFGGSMKLLRTSKEVTQQELADKLGISVAYVSLLERGGRNPPLTTVIEIAKALKGDVRDLVPPVGK